MGERRAIVGLGNPGPRYDGTRHNIGFVVVDAVGARVDAPLERADHGALWSRASSEDFGEIFFAKPQSYMNRSGEPLAALLEDWAVAPTDVLVVHDDVDLEIGRLKLKQGGGMGGHRGLLSIEEETGTRDFCRLRFGVGRPLAGQDTAEYVLERFPGSADEEMAGAVVRARDGALDWLRLDFQAAMKNVNTWAEKPVEPDGSGC
ncbi:MAG: aminoacyl-tRNA hydrolase [Candidatus Binatia bacterium]|nr:aminoacyl-tRNA hydrolase [Candidatus Binatia bacterium]